MCSRKVDVERLPLFDIEYLFLKLRSRSVGEISEIGLKCTTEGCDCVTQISINMDEIEVTKPEGHNRKIMISDDVGVMMSYPVMKTSGITEEDGMAIVKDCIEMIFTEEETHERDSFTSKELDEFIDSMDTKQLQKSKSFFDTMPKLQHTINYKCEKCGERTKKLLYKDLTLFRVEIESQLSLENYYLTNFAMIQHHKWSLTELEDMMPYEREIYVTLLTNWVQEENEKE